MKNTNQPSWRNRPPVVTNPLTNRATQNINNTSAQKIAGPSGQSAANSGRHNDGTLGRRPELEQSSLEKSARPQRRWIPLWVWLLLPFVALAAGGWWVYQSLVVSNLDFATQTVITNGASVIDTVKRVNKQVFIEHYETIDIDYREAPKNWLSYLGVEQSFVLLMRGQVPAGIDLSLLTAQSVWTSGDGRRVQLTLPPPQVFEENVSIDFERTRILAINDTCPDLICENDVMAYQNQLLPEGRALMIDSAVESGILSTVAEDAKAYYEELLKGLGFEEVKVVVTGY